MRLAQTTSKDKRHGVCSDTGCLLTLREGAPFFSPEDAPVELMPHRFATILFALVLSVFAQAQETPPSVRNFLDLEAYAAKLAEQPYKPAQQALDPFFDKLEYDGHRQIQFIQDK